MRNHLLALAALALTGCPFEELPTDQGTAAGNVRVFGSMSAKHRANVDPKLRSALLASISTTRPTRTGVANAASRLASVKTAKVMPKLLVDGTLYGRNEPQVIRPGEVIVRFTERLTAAEALKRLQVDGLTLQHGGFASDYLHLARFTGAKGRMLSEGETRELVAKLSSRAGVKFTEPNGIRHALMTPNDKLYPAMWHLPPINLPAAWDLERGLTNTVNVAVVDTGIYAHPDLSARVAQGYDMITDTAISNDGDGRDSDATDPGKDQPQGRSSWHGTHCAGTIGASTDNDTGIAGVNWNARIVPVRVLGKGGGTDFDISAGMNWASGGNVPGTSANANPAAVVSMSLGGQGGPLQSYQDIIDDAASRNVVFVIAAGNDNTDAANFTPCNQTGVLCIGATRFNGKRASYSNYGNRVDLMAPGGEVAEDANGDTYPDGVLSTVKDDSDGSPAYAFENGTSMATPHVAGIVSLMKAKVPGLTFAQAKSALTSTANTASQCSEGCGAGLVDVVAALRAVSGAAPTGPAKLSLGTAEMLFTPGHSQASLQITNTGGMQLDVSLTLGGADASRISLGSTSLAIPAGASRQVTVAADLSGLAQGASAAAVLSVASNGGNAAVSLKLRVANVSTKGAVVALAYQDTAGEWQIAASIEAVPSGFAYSLNAPVRKYYVVGVQDANSNGEFDDVDPFGLYPNSDSPKEIELVAGQTMSGLDFTLAPQTDLTDNMASVIGTACTQDATCAPGICGTGFPGGYCTADCASNACPLGARCIAGDSVSFCLASCTGARAGQSSCRAGYVCEDDGTGSGVCIPACTADAACAPSTCNTATGYCR